MTQERLAALVRAHKLTVLKLEKGLLPFNEQWHAPFSEALNVPVIDLFPTKYTSTGIPARRVPVIAWTSAGKPMAALQEEIDDTTPTVTTSEQSETLLAVRVVGSSMNRIAPEGFYAVYDYTDKELVDRKCYLIRIDGEVTFKRYRDTGGPPRLEPDSTESHETLYPAEPVEVIGRVIEVTQKL